MNSTTIFWYAFAVFITSVFGWALSHDMQLLTQYMSFYIVIVAGTLLVASVSQIGDNKLELMKV
jgi:hypothetical protein